MSETIYSWSRINSFHLAMTGDGCLYNWHKNYIEGDRGDGNYFSEYGTLVHETIEKLHKNEISVFDIDSELNNGLANFQYYAPFPRMRDSYKAALFRFFEEDYFGVFKDYEILESEEEKTFKVGEYSLRGFPDLITNHKEHGLAIVDYKSSKVYAGAKLKHNIQQLYLYAIPIKEKYGRYPDSLIYIYPREQGQKDYAYKFDIDELKRTEQFVIDTIEQIKKHEDWEPRCNSVDVKKDFYVNHLCNGRLNCTHRTNNQSE